jgi:hypothetical protein
LIKISIKDVVVPIIVAIVALLGTSLTLIVSAALRPDISIDVITDEKTPEKVNVTLTNKGYAAATRFGFTMEFPHSISMLSIFSTELYNSTNSTSNLRVDIPRLVQGEGTIMRIEAVLSPSSEITVNDKYNIYGTYDQGSIKKVKFILPQPPLPYLEVVRQFLDEFNANFGWIGILLAIVTLVTFAFTFIFPRLKRLIRTMK